MRSVMLEGRESRSLKSKQEVSRPCRSAASAVRRSWRRPVPMTFFPCAWMRRARPAPIPDVAPMMRMVFLIDMVCRNL